MRVRRLAAQGVKTLREGWRQAPRVVQQRRHHDMARHRRAGTGLGFIFTKG
jgi:hypothetical protein